MTDPSSNTTNVRPAVAVYGAAGHTGRFVIRELLRRGYAPVALGRDAAKLAAAGFPAGVKREAVSLDDPAGLARALAGAVAVVNVAGPFLDTAEPLVRAALESRVHYVDVTAEQASARATFEHAAAAERAGVVLLPAMGFYGGLGDLLVTAAMGDRTRADEVRIAIALDSWEPTEGTRLTGKRNTVPRVTISGGELAPLPTPAPTAVWDFAEPFGRQEMMEMPFTEVVHVARHLEVGELHGYLNAKSIGDIRDPSTPPPKPADESGRSAQRFRVEVEVRLGEEVRRAEAEGRDIYAVTAPLVVEAVDRILRDGSAGGAFAPGELFDAAEFLAALEPSLVG